MSDKIDCETVEKEKEKITEVSSPTPSEEAVSNGLVSENKKVEDISGTSETTEITKKEDLTDSNTISPDFDKPSRRSVSRKSSINKESEDTDNMTNKETPVKPVQRTRMRSRSKSSNSEDLKLTKSACSEDKQSEDSPSKDSVDVQSQNNDQDATPEAEQNESPDAKEEQDKDNDQDNDIKSNSVDAMDVDDVKCDDNLPDSGISEPISTPMIVEDDNSSDFPGFESSEDKYPAFSVVLRPYEEASVTIKTKSGSQNGPLSLKHVSNTSRPTPVRSIPANRIDITDTAFLKPFDYGWRRELVFRSTSENPSRRNADVYYYTPLNKKVRSLREVLEHLIPGEGLSAENFTFCKESLCINDPDKEVIREAKWKQDKNRLDDGFYTLPVKKTTPKAKAVKSTSSTSAQKTKEKKESFKEIELSPSSSPSTSSSSPLTPRIVMKTTSGLKVNSKRINLKVEKRRKAAGPDDSSLVDTIEDWCAQPKAQVREVCSIECRLAMGLIPTLQCVKCLCLYHPECVNLLEAKERQIHSYVCKYCQNDAKQASKLPPPPPLTPIIMTPNQKKDKEPIKVVVSTPNITSAGSTRSQTIVGAVTTWLPPASSIIGCKGPPPIAPRPELESSPQSLISVQGKKYVVIPKVNRVKLDGRGEGGGGDDIPVPTTTTTSTVQTTNPASSVYLVPYNLPSTSSTYVVQATNASTPTYIVTSGSSSSGSLTNGLKRSGSDTGSGSDGSPPVKMSAVSPKSVPTVKAVGVPKPAPKVSPAPKQGSAKSPAQLLSVPSHLAPIPISHTTDFMNLFNAGYTGILHAFQYLKVHELLRAACVCKMWRHMATHRSLWETVKMKNSRVRNWEGFGRSLRTNGTKCLDLKKMLVPEGSEAVTEMWKNLVDALKTIPSLTKIDMGRCSPENLEMVTKACPQLESIFALSIRGQSLNLNMFKGDKLVELKLKSVGGMDLTHFYALKELKNLTHLSLTSVKVLTGLQNALPTSLESLELGECCQISERFATETLPKLRNLKRLRLEKGQGSLCPTIQIINSISGLEKLAQLELINFDIKPGFDKALAKCAHVKTLLIIPTYVTQSATTNHVVMGGVTKLAATLEYFIWGLTLELLRVTDLFIDQVEGQKQKQAQSKKGAGDSIPILKPLSDENAEMSREGQTTSQVDILALPKLQRVLSTLLPTTRIKILKVPFSATWRQTIH